MSQRVAIYARYSSENQREASIEDQLRICRARAERAGWTIVAEFTDAAISGTKDNRPGFIALREAARAGKLDVILAESLDRFSRDLEHVAAFHKQVTFCRVKLVTLADGEISDLHVGVKGAIPAGGSTFGSCLTAMLAGSTKGGVREKFPSPPACLTPRAAAPRSAAPCRGTPPPPAGARWTGSSSPAASP